MAWSHPELAGETFDHREVGAADQLGMLRGDAVERAVAERDRAVGVVVGLVAPAGEHLAQGSEYRLPAALGGRAPGRLGAEFAVEGAGGVVERDAGGAGPIGLHSPSEQLGQGGVVARLYCRNGVPIAAPWSASCPYCGGQPVTLVPHPSTDAWVIGGP